jgi:TetR/AcrR family transcriptional repressor of mexCD-oprJ operon
MDETATTDSRYVTAERNLKAILDGTERLVRRGEQPSISAVASEAGVSRPTVYAHFTDRRALLQALVERTVRETMSAIRSAEVDRDSAAEALPRLIEASWEQIANHDEIASVAARELSADAMRAAHQSARSVMCTLIDRGRGEGSFRTDLPADWLAAAALALIHAAAEEVRAGQLDRDSAQQVLSVTVGELLRART